uniref:Cytochrome b n=1 Tax=Tessmannella kiplingi TaxID=2943473 RepID=A0A9E8G805_9HYME|nr:cytochrome b [Tessmannella kiplingi]
MVNNNKFSKVLKESISIPLPMNISILWNFGSLLGLCLSIQIITGLFLSMHYISNVNYSFNMIIHIMQDVNYGWFMRLMHMNTASFYFMFMFIHIGRGMYYNSYKLVYTWIIGSLIFIISMATAFLGYVLPWGQMSFWGATVITNLLSAVPVIGQNIVLWLWGGFSVDNPSLNRFYSLHFILPFFIFVLMMVHLMFLHVSGSNNPLGLNSNMYKIPFHNYFTIKDIQGFLVLIIIMLLLCNLGPYLLGDPENFNFASSFVTPIHIQPEWYFLFAYAILRSVPNKLGGVIGLLMSIVIIMILPFFNTNKMQTMEFYPINQVLFWNFVNIFILLTWIGMKTIEMPYILLGKILTIMYFMYFIMNFIIFKFWDNYIFMY